MEAKATDRRRRPRNAKNVRFCFYFLGQTREVYSVDIGFNGAFIQTDVFPPLGSFIILEHYHLKRQGVTVGLVGKIRRIQTPFQATPNLRGVGVEWVRAYCNQGFLPLKRFLAQELGHDPFDWDTELAYQDYDKKVVFDFASGGLSPTREELETVFFRERRAKSTPGARRSEESRPKVDSRGPTRELPGPGPDRRTPRGAEASSPAELRRGGGRPGAASPEAAPPDAGRGRASSGEVAASSPTAREPAPAPAGMVSASVAKAARAEAEARRAHAAGLGGLGKEPPGSEGQEDRGGDGLIPVEIKVVFGVGNRMFYGVVRGLSERELAIVTSGHHVLREGQKVQVRVPLQAKSYRYMVVIYGDVTEVRSEGEGSHRFRVRIRSLDEFQNPGGYRYFLRGLRAKSPR